MGQTYVQYLLLGYLWAFSTTILCKRDRSTTSAYCNKAVKDDRPKIISSPTIQINYFIHLNAAIRKIRIPNAMRFATIAQKPMTFSLLSQISFVDSLYHKLYGIFNKIYRRLWRKISVNWPLKWIICVVIKQNQHKQSGRKRLHWSLSIEMIRWHNLSRHMRWKQILLLHTHMLNLISSSRRICLIHSNIDWYQSWLFWIRFKLSNTAVNMFRREFARNRGNIFSNFGPYWHIV